MLTFSHVFIGLVTTWTLCNWSLFRVQPRVLQMLWSPLPTPGSGKHAGRTKSVISTGSSSRTRATRLPSTGERTIPIILCSCCHGVVLWIRTVPKRAVHSALGWPCEIGVNLIRDVYSLWYCCLYSFTNLEARSRCNKPRRMNKRRVTCVYVRPQQRCVPRPIPWQSRSWKSVYALSRMTSSSWRQTALCEYKVRR